MNMKKILLLMLPLLTLGCQAQEKKNFDFNKYKDVIMNEYAYPPRFAKSADDVVRSGGQSITKAEKYAEREEDYKLLRAEYDKISRECSKILRAIFNISDLDLQNVVYAYYVLGMSFKEISYSQHISEVTAKRWRDKGVNILNFKK